MELTSFIEQTRERGCRFSLSLSGIALPSLQQLSLVSATLDFFHMHIQIRYLKWKKADNGLPWPIYQMDLRFCFETGLYKGCVLEGRVVGSDAGKHDSAWCTFDSKEIKTKTVLVRSPARAQLDKYLNENNAHDHHQAVRRFVSVLLTIASDTILSKFRLFIVPDTGSNKDKKE